MILSSKFSRIFQRRLAFLLPEPRERLSYFPLSGIVALRGCSTTDAAAEVVVALVQPRVQPFLEHRQQRQHFQFLTSPRISRRSDGCVSKNDCWLCLLVWFAKWAMQPSMAHNMVWICFQSNADADADADAARLVVRWVVEQLILVPPVYRENPLNLRETHAPSPLWVPQYGSNKRVSHAPPRAWVPQLIDKMCKCSGTCPVSFVYSIIQIDKHV